MNDLNKMAIAAIVLMLALAGIAAIQPVKADYRVDVFPKNQVAHSIWYKRFISFADCREERMNVLFLLAVTGAQPHHVTCTKVEE